MSGCTWCADNGGGAAGPDFQTKEDKYSAAQTRIDSVNYKVCIPMERYTPVIAHFLPSQFPMPAHLDRRIIDSCRRCWLEIYYGEAGAKRNTFCTVFYAKLLKKSPRFADIFPKGSQGVLFKHDLLGKAMNMVTTLDLETCTKRLTALGAFHNKLCIRPWMYSDYFVTVVEALCEVLGDQANYGRMEQWYQALGYVCFYMLEGALVGKVIEGEVGVGSYYGEFQGDRRLEIVSVVQLNVSGTAD